MESNNQHIKDFLTTRYCKLAAPEYAVLLNGSWGSGKTWFIKQILKELKNSEQKSFYVSLYGVKSIEEIENEFFRQLHPFLASKGMRLLGKVIKGGLNVSLRVDLDNNGKPESTGSIGVPKDKIWELKIPDNSLLIFDDLERCSMSIADVLGYINQFVEHEELKVILIADESKINIESDSNKSLAYINIKEKLIGKTFTIHPELKLALTSFIEQIQSNKAKSAMSENQTVIENIYNYSGYKNLRILKQSLWDFEPFFSVLSDEIIDNKPLVSELLSLFLVYSIEIKIGSITAEKLNIFKASVDPSSSSKKDENHSKETCTDLSKKYLIHVNNLSYNLLPKSLWTSIFTTWIIPKNEIEEALYNSRHFITSEAKVQANWVKLWNYVDLSDTEFEKTLSDVSNEWERYDDTYDIGVVKHIVAMFLYFYDCQLYKKPKDKILNHAKLFIDKLEEMNKLPKSRNWDEIGASHGLGYLQNGAGLSDLNDYIYKKIEDALPSDYKQKADELLDIMQKDIKDFYLKLAEHPFNNISILSYMLVDEFASSFLDKNPEQIRYIINIFNARYKNNSNFTDELSWLKQLKERIEPEVKLREGKLSGYSISLVLKSLSEAITTLEETNEKIGNS